MANQSRFSTYSTYMAEVVAGTTPAIPAMIMLPTTDPLALQKGKDTFASEQVYAHRQATELIDGRKNIGGNIPIEFQYGAYDDFLEALLGGSWTTALLVHTLKVGNAVNTFTIERLFPDITQHETFTGVTPTQLTLDVNSDGIVTGSFGMVGMGWTDLSATKLTGANPVDNSNPPFAGLCKMVLKEDNTVLATATSLNLSIDNGMSVTGYIGSCDASEPSPGDFAITGSLTARLTDDTLIAKFEGNTSTSLEIQFEDALGNKRVITLHNLRYTNANPQVNENAVDISLDITALYDSTEETSISIVDTDIA